MASPNGDTLYKFLRGVDHRSRLVEFHSPGCGVHANRVSPFSESIVAETMAVTMVL
jgi:hypothetical protein